MPAATRSVHKGAHRPCIKSLNASSTAARLTTFACAFRPRYVPFIRRKRAKSRWPSRPPTSWASNSPPSALILRAFSRRVDHSPSWACCTTFAPRTGLQDHQATRRTRVAIDRVSLAGEVMRAIDHDKFGAAVPTASRIVFPDHCRHGGPCAMDSPRVFLIRLCPRIPRELPQDCPILYQPLHHGSGVRRNHTCHRELCPRCRNRRRCLRRGHRATARSAIVNRYHDASPRMPNGRSAGFFMFSRPAFVL